MKRKISIILAIGLTCILLFTGCSMGPSNEDQMKDTVTTFFDDVKSSNFESAKKQLNDSKVSDDTASAIFDGSEDSEDNESPNATKEFLSIVKDSNSKLTYEIKDAKVDEKDDTKGTVTVSVKYVDNSSVIKKMMENYLIYAFSNIGEDISDEDADQKMAEYLKDAYDTDDVEYSNQKVKLSMEKTDDDWKIADINDDMINIITQNMSKAMDDVNDSLDE